MQSNIRKPSVTIGIPVYNEEKYLAGTINSILEQDYHDFEIIISDNASTDKTLEIISEYVNKDDRIILVKQEKNIGALQNCNTLIRKANGQYFTFMGAHDLWSKNYLSVLVELLEKNPNAVIAQGITVWIDEDGNKIPRSSGYIETSGFNQKTRLNLSMWGNQNALYGIQRISALRNTRLQLEVIGSGSILLSELSLLGDFVVDQKAVWFRRINREKESYEQQLDRYYMNLFSKKRIRFFPHWKFFFKYLSVPFNKSLSFHKRISFFSMIFFNFLFIHGNKLIFDFLSFIRRLFTGSLITTIT